MIVDPSTPINADVVVKIVYTDSVYSYTESITLRLNAAYIDFEANNLASTASSNGRIGYFGFQQDQGQGLSFKGSASLFYDMALMVGTSGSVVSDAARAGNGADADNDFQYTTPVQKVSSQVADVHITSSFTDQNSTLPIGLSIHQSYLGWAAAPDTNFFIYRLVLRNTGNQAISNLHVGLFSDFDISTSGAEDQCKVDTARRLGYIYHNTPNGLYGGISSLDASRLNIYPIENDATSANMVGIYNGYTTQEKYKTLSSGIAAAGAGLATATGKDVSVVVGVGPYSIPVGDSIAVAFAIVAGESLAQLQSATDQAKTKYNQITSIRRPLAKAQALQFAPNPTRSGSLRISFQGAAAHARVVVTGSDGRLHRLPILQAFGSGLVVDTKALAPGVYSATISTSNGIGKGTFVVQ